MATRTRPTPGDPHTLPLFTHDPGLDTEHEAAVASAPKLGGLLGKLVPWLRERGTWGATKHEVDAALGTVDAEGSRALYALREMGLAVLLKESRRGENAKRAHVCVLKEFQNDRPLAQKERL